VDTERFEPRLLQAEQRRSMGVGLTQGSARKKNEVMELISDNYLFGLCVGLLALLAIPLAWVDGADDPMAHYLAERKREIAKERRALPWAVATLPQRPRRKRAERRQSFISDQERKRLTKKITIKVRKPTGFS
jgi:hypothetical protein